MNQQADRVVPTGECYDCGGRCVLGAHVKDGRIIRIEMGDQGAFPYRACAKGRAYRQMVNSPDRLLHPLKRRGERGSGNFERISWEEALGTVAGELKRVKATYGPQSIFFISGSGNGSALNGMGLPVARLLNMFGGYTAKWGSASAEGSRFSSMTTFGTLHTANSRDDLLNSRLIIMWGWNPAVSSQGRGTVIYLAEAREKGTRIIAVDPRFSQSAAVFADEWIPIRPGSDTAMLAAMAYLMVKENLHDVSFLEKYTVGFEQFKDYLLGVSDGVVKSPAWAEQITGVPRARIEKLAREYATVKPAALMPGFAAGRTAFGEQYHRACAALSAMTGNIGNHGGNAAGHGLSLFGPMSTLPTGNNPLEQEVPQLNAAINPALKSRYRVQTGVLWDAILQGKAGGYPADLKLLYIASSNCLNQYLNSNKGMAALKAAETVVVHEQFMTATARFADIVLPVCMSAEYNDIAAPGYPEPYYVYVNKATEPQGESRSDFEIASALAPLLGLENFSGKTEVEWHKQFVQTSQITDDFEGFRATGIQRKPMPVPKVSLKPQIESPGTHKFPTPSGKIEIFSQQIADWKIPGLTPIPCYLESGESPLDPQARLYPLQLITSHSLRRANSCFELVPWLNETDAQVIIMNPIDAAERGIADGDEVETYNSRGRMVLRACVTGRIMPGVVDINQGAWFQPDAQGIDRGGCPNTLSRDWHSPGGAFPSNTCLVQVVKTAG